MSQITMEVDMSQITMSSAWVKLLWVVHMSQITMSSTYESNWIWVVHMSQIIYE